MVVNLIENWIKVMSGFEIVLFLQSSSFIQLSLNSSIIPNRSSPVLASDALLRFVSPKSCIACFTFDKSCYWSPRLIVMILSSWSYFFAPGSLGSSHSGKSTGLKLSSDSGGATINSASKLNSSVAAFASSFSSSAFALWFFIAYSCIFAFCTRIYSSSASYYVLGFHGIGGFSRSAAYMFVPKWGRVVLAILVAWGYGSHLSECIILIFFFLIS